MSTSSVRVSVECYLKPYLDEIGEKMGCEKGSYSKIVNLLLTEHRMYFNKFLIPTGGLIQMPTPNQVKAVAEQPNKLNEEAIANSLAGLLDAA